jgi:hypothetical protein
MYWNCSLPAASFSSALASLRFEEVGLAPDEYGDPVH